MIALITVWDHYLLWFKIYLYQSKARKLFLMDGLNRIRKYQYMNKNVLKYLKVKSKFFYITVTWTHFLIHWQSKNSSLTTSGQPALVYSGHENATCCNLRKTHANRKKTWANEENIFINLTPHCAHNIVRVTCLQVAHFAASWLSHAIWEILGEHSAVK